MKTDRDVEKLVAEMDLKRGPKKAVVQYGKGMLEGMRMAYLAVAKRMLAAGQTEAEVRRLLAPLVDKKELDALLEEAAGA